MPFRGAYVAKKFAINGLTEAMRVEMQGSGIEFILIEPGPIRTDFRKKRQRCIFKIYKTRKQCLPKKIPRLDKTGHSRRGQKNALQPAPRSSVR